MPPRRSTAIVWASMVSLFAWPPWMACIERACPRTNGSPSWAHRSARQVLGEETFNRDHHLFTRGGHGLEQRLRAGGPMAMHHDLTVVVQNTDVHGASMQVNAAVTWVLLGGEAHEVSSSAGLLFPLPAVPPGYAEEGASRGGLNSAPRSAEMEWTNT